MIETINEKKIITTPITDEDIRSLKAGDVFYLTGDVLTGRDDVHKRVAAEGMDFPADPTGKAIFHAGPIVKEKADGSYEMVSIGPTTSMRMEEFESDFLEKTGIKLVIGKGGMGQKTADACRKLGALHCAAPAGCAVIGASCVKEISGAYWPELGMPEAVWHLKVREFGPLIVTIDSEGRNYYEEKKREYTARRVEILSESETK